MVVRGTKRARTDVPPSTDEIARFEIVGCVLGAAFATYDISRVDEVPRLLFNNRGSEIELLRSVLPQLIQKAGGKSTSTPYKNLRSSLDAYLDGPATAKKADVPQSDKDISLEVFIQNAQKSVAARSRWHNLESFDDDVCTKKAKGTDERPKPNANAKLASKSNPPALPDVKAWTNDRPSFPNNSASNPGAAKRKSIGSKMQEPAAPKPRPRRLNKSTSQKVAHMDVQSAAGFTPCVSASKRPAMSIIELLTQGSLEAAATAETIASGSKKDIDDALATMMVACTPQRRNPLQRHASNGIVPFAGAGPDGLDEDGNSAPVPTALADKFAAEADEKESSMMISFPPMPSPSVARKTPMKRKAVVTNDQPDWACEEVEWPDGNGTCECCGRIAYGCEAYGKASVILCSYCRKARAPMMWALATEVFRLQSKGKRAIKVVGVA